MADFRSQRSPTPDGQGLAKGRFERAWEAYSKAVLPVGGPLSNALRPVLWPFARGMTFDLIGFWTCWHILGGFDGLRTHLGMSRSAIYRRVAVFRQIMGEHPDTYRFPGITLDVEGFLRDSAASAPDQAEASE